MVTGERQTLVKALLQQIEAVRHTAQPKLPGERELASANGASRTSVREVLGVLEALRVIERRPQSGIYVCPAESDASIEALVLQEAHDVRASATSYDQAQEARVLLETEAARLAAKLRTTADLNLMRTIIDKSRRNNRLKRNLAPDDEAFHLAMIAGAKNPILLRIARSLYLMTRSVRYAYFKIPGTNAPSITEHEALLDSVAKRDGKRAVRLLRRHYARSSALRKRMQTDG